MSVFDLQRTPVHSGPRPSKARGKVVKPLPVSEADSLHVSLFDYPTDQAYEVVAGNWASRGLTLPKAGAVCLVVFDHYGDAWVPIWRGVSSYPPGLYSGHGDPGTAIGAVGDFYLDLDSLQVWGPKAATWPSVAAGRLQAD